MWGVFEFQRRSPVKCRPIVSPRRRAHYVYLADGNRLCWSLSLKGSSPPWHWCLEHHKGEGSRTHAYCPNKLCRALIVPRRLPLPVAEWNVTDRKIGYPLSSDLIPLFSRSSLAAVTCHFLSTFALILWETTFLRKICPHLERLVNFLWDFWQDDFLSKFWHVKCKILHLLIS